MSAAERSPAPIRTLVAIAEQLVRVSVASLLDEQPDIRVVAETGDADMAEREVERVAPDVAVLDAALRPRTGVELCSQLRAARQPSQGQATKVLVLAEHPDHGMLLAAVEAGADGFVAHGRGAGGLLEAIRQIHAGRASVPPEMLGVLLRDLIHRRRDEDAIVERFARLSQRERQVFTLLVGGRDNRSIGAELGLSPNTARTHVQHVLEKLGVHSRAEAIAMDGRHDLIGRFGHLDQARQ